MRRPIFFGSLYALFLLWQNRWFSKPLTEVEVDDYLDKLATKGKEQESADSDQASFRAFLLADDGKPFYMVNLMQYRKQALYPDGSHPEVETEHEANTLYSKSVCHSQHQIP